MRRSAVFANPMLAQDLFVAHMLAAGNDFAILGMVAGQPLPHSNNMESEQQPGNAASGHARAESPAAPISGGPLPRRAAIFARRYHIEGVARCRGDGKREPMTRWSWPVRCVYYQPCHIKSPPAVALPSLITPPTIPHIYEPRYYDIIYTARAGPLKPLTALCYHDTPVHAPGGDPPFLSPFQRCLFWLRLIRKLHNALERSERLPRPGTCSAPAFFLIRRQKLCPYSYVCNTPSPTTCVTQGHAANAETLVSQVG